MKILNTKKTLLMSLLVTVVCFSLLVGTTLAWFTDSATSSTNVISAGTLDVGLLHTNGVDTNEEVEATTALFDIVDPENWEPGAVAWEKFTVTNDGSLALKYRFSLNVANDTVIDTVSFASLLKVAVIEDASFEYTRENIEAIPADQWTSLAQFSREGVLEATANTAYGVVIYWQPSAADNAVNMNNGKAGGPVSVDVSVTLVATQTDSRAELPTP